MGQFSRHTHCPNCFTSPKPDPVCVHCGFDYRQYSDNVRYLDPFTRLSESLVVGRVLGEGGFAIVYGGYEDNFGHVAVKEFFPERVDLAYRTSNGLVKANSQKPGEFDRWRKRFVRESRLLWEFRDSANIVNPAHIINANGTIYLVMERLQGCDLNDYIAEYGHRNVLDEGQAQTVFRNVLYALGVLHNHAAPVIHRDVSLKNIYLVDKHPEKIKLLDFGLARGGEQLSTHTLTTAGTLEFASPEQLQGQPIGPYTDIYSLAAVIYTTVTGSAPHIMQRLGRSQSLDQERLAHLSPAFRNTLCRCLQLEAAMRPQNVDAVFHLLDMRSRADAGQTLVADYLQDRQRDDGPISERVSELDDEVGQAEPEQEPEQEPEPMISRSGLKPVQYSLSGATKPGHTAQGANWATVLAWLLVLCLPIFSFKAKLAFISVNLVYLYIPVAAWLGYRLRRRAIVAVAVGASPLLFGFYLGEFISRMSSGLYLVVLMVCWAFAESPAWWRRLSQNPLTPLTVVTLFIAGGVVFFLRLPDFLFLHRFSFGWHPSPLWLPLAGLLMGMVHGRHWQFTGIAVGLLLFGWLVDMVGPSWYRIDSGEGILIAANTYDTFFVFSNVMFMYYTGVQVIRGLQGRTTVHPGLFSLLIVIAWFWALHPLHFYNNRYIFLAAWPVMMFSSAFAAGLCWQLRGVAYFSALWLLSLIEVLLLMQEGGTLNMGPVYIRIANPDYLYILFASLPFYYLGMRTARALELDVAFSPRLPWQRHWMANVGERAEAAAMPSDARRHSGMAPWLWMLLLPLLDLKIRISHQSINIWLLSIPMMLWMANRYGRNGLIAVAFGMLIYLIGIRIDDIYFRHSIDLYIIAVLAAWVVTTPGAVEKLLHRISRPGIVALILVVVPFYFKLPPLWLEDVRIYVGWHASMLLPFLLLLLGWSGRSIVLVLILLPAFAFLGIVVPWEEWFNKRYIGYGIDEVRDLLLLMVCYLMGLAMHRHRNTPGAPVSGHVLMVVAGVIMCLAPIAVSYNQDGDQVRLWGFSYLILFVAFAAGYIWRQRGMALTVFSVFFGANLIMLTLALGLESNDGLSVASRLRELFVTVFAPLYCYLGIRVSQGMQMTFSSFISGPGNSTTGRPGL